MVHEILLPFSLFEGDAKIGRNLQRHRAFRRQTKALPTARVFFENQPQSRPLGSTQPALRLQNRHRPQHQVPQSQNRHHRKNRRTIKQTERIWHGCSTNQSELGSMRIGNDDYNDFMPNNIDKERVVVRKPGKPVTRPIPVDSDCAALIASMPCKVGMSGHNNQEQWQEGYLQHIRTLT